MLLHANAMLTTRIVSRKLNLQYPYDSGTQQKNVVGHVLKPYDSCSQNQNVK